MVATFDRETVTLPRRRGALGSWVASILDRLYTHWRKAADRRLMEEMPDPLLMDMGIRRVRTGTPPPWEAAAILRDPGGWR